MSRFGGYLEVGAVVHYTGRRLGAWHVSCNSRSEQKLPIGMVGTYLSTYVEHLGT